MPGRIWNKLTEGYLSRGAYFGWTLLGNITLSIIGSVLFGLVAEALTLGVALLLIGVALVFSLGCMMRRLRHAGRDKSIAVWWLIAQIAVLVIVFAAPVEIWQLASLVYLVFWICIGVLKPHPYFTVKYYEPGKEKIEKPS